MLKIDNFWNVYTSQDHFDFSMNNRWKEVKMVPRDQKGGWSCGPEETVAEHITWRTGARVTYRRPCDVPAPVWHTGARVTYRPCSGPFMWTKSSQQLCETDTIISTKQIAYNIRLSNLTELHPSPVVSSLPSVSPLHFLLHIQLVKLQPLLNQTNNLSRPTPKHLNYKLTVSLEKI